MTAFSANIDVPLEERLAAIVESSDDAIISKNLDGIILTWNEGATRLFGYAAEEAVGRSVTMLIPEDRPNEELEILARLRRGERISHYETVRRRKDGHLVDISLTVSPIKNARGIVVGASKIARDITERKKAHEQQSLLLQEMNHRINNLYAVARNIVSLSARSSTTPAEMAQAITGRLDALANAQRLAHPESHDRNIDLRGGTTLDALIRVIASPYDDPARNRGGAVVVADGPVVCIDAQAVSAVSLVLHELATNAVKYGALSADGGCAHIVWAVEGDRLVLQWQESGGPAIAGPPDRSGFGTLLVQGAIATQLGGEAHYDWNPSGLGIRLSVPLKNLTPGGERALD